MKYISSILLGVASLALACSVNVSAGAGAPAGEDAASSPARPDVEDETTPQDAEPGDAGAAEAAPETELAVPDSSPATKACTTSEDCGDGMVCEGEGCGEGQGVCAAKDRMCTRDLQTYCGCDGVEFQSSGSCPGQRYSVRGACPDAPT